VYGEVAGSKPGLCILHSILPVSLRDPCVSLRDPPVSPAGPARQPSCGTLPSAMGPARQPACPGTRSSAMGPARQPSHGTRLSAQVDQMQGLPMGPTRMPWTRWQVNLGPARQPCSQTRPWDPPVSHGARLPGPLDPPMSGSVGGIHLSGLLDPSMGPVVRKFANLNSHVDMTRR
jgi:hypothetical protein